MSHRAPDRFVAFSINALASGLYLSYLPARVFRDWRYSGTGWVGALWGVAALPILPLNAARQAAVLAGCFCIAVVVCGWSEQLLERQDDPRIVLDEFLGYWVAVSFLPRTLLTLILAFVLFRLFDVLKPLGVRRMGELPGGWGVVLDDALAGFYANVLLRVAVRIHPF